MEKRYVIDSFDEIKIILEDLNPNKNRIIMGFDWDNCISLYNGCQSPLRENEITIDVFDYINKMNILWFIITARFGGDDPSTSINFDEAPDEIKLSHSGICIKKMVDSMYEELSPMVNRINVGRLDTENVLIIKHEFGGISDENCAYSIINRGVVFAGGRSDNFNKGKAILNYMAMGFLPPVMDWDVFIFVDNDLDNVIKVENAFRAGGFSNKLITVYYPQIPLLYGKCNNNYNPKRCFTDMKVFDHAKEKINKDSVFRVTSCQNNGTSTCSDKPPILKSETPNKRKTTFRRR